ncbi:CgeB family protein [Flavobacterium cerinum]|uniref:Glycosyltransferase n=1 Tax=Flavobacterium cerinum TaxID=2502784 RepID=A0ABY5IW13_9FLAO|nr:glycosyltransferase [Flavobacterium cerinum]UUC47019.1 glycosyltransferase [Flavobacterium cerinum]
MKIAIIGSAKFDSLEFHIQDELLVQGHEAKIFDYESVFSGRMDMGLSLISTAYVDKKNRKLLKNILAFGPDFVIGVYRHIHPFVVKAIKQENIRIIHVNPDQLTTLQNQQLFVEPYDVYFTKDPYMVSFMKNKLNLNARLYSEAFNDRIHKRPIMDAMELEKEIDIDVLCFGNLYPYRNRMLHLLKEDGIKLTLFGNKAKYFDPFLETEYQNRGIYGEEKAKILNGAKIVFNNFHYAEIESVNNKFFEISGAGAFQICDYKPILKELLPVDPKLVSFESIDEAKKLMHFYLNKPEKRYELRDIILNHFKENYTYKQLIKTILE